MAVGPAAISKRLNGCRSETFQSVTGDRRWQKVIVQRAADSGVPNGVRRHVAGDGGGKSGFRQTRKGVLQRTSKGFMQGNLNFCGEERNSSAS
ncbi:hypothetical protein Ancab_002338 [Ancistrocladus abbreviatus]